MNGHWGHEVEMNAISLADEVLRVGPERGRLLACPRATRRESTVGGHSVCEEPVHGRSGRLVQCKQWLGEIPPVYSVMRKWVLELIAERISGIREGAYDDRGDSRSD